MRPGTPGLDVLKIAGASISGWYPSEKTAGPGRQRQPFTTQLEFMLWLYLEYHPWVARYQRGDMSEAFVRAHQLAAPLGTPYAITYLFEGAAHDYLPDFVGALGDGKPLIAEAGRTEDKAKGRAAAKAEAARRLVQLQGGVYWIGTEETLSRCRHQNLIFLHTGLRAGEVCGLRRADVTLGKRSGSLRVIGKHNKEREVPLNATARTALQEYSDRTSACQIGKVEGRGSLVRYVA